MHVLQDAVFVVFGGNSEVAGVFVVPDFGQVTDVERSLEQPEFKLKADDDVQIVGHFVGIGADQRALYFVDGAIEGLERYVFELCWEGSLQAGVVVLPEGPRSADLVFPQA